MIHARFLKSLFPSTVALNDKVSTHLRHLLSARYQLKVEDSKQVKNVLRDI